MVKLLPVAAGVLGFESEGDVVFLVGLQFVSRQLQLLLSYAMNTKGRCHLENLGNLMD